MSLVNVLIRPKMLDRYAADDLRIGDVLVELFGRLAADAAQEGATVKRIGKAAEQALNELNQEVSTRIQRSTPAIEQWFRPISENLLQGFSTIGDPKTAESAAQSLASLLEWLAATLESLSAETIAGHIKTLVLIIEEDIGFTFERFGKLLRDASEVVIAALTADYLNGVHTERAKGEFVVGSHLAWLRRFYETELPIDLGAIRLRDLADLLALELPRTDWDTMRLRLAQLFRDLGVVLGSLSGQFEVGVGGSVGARSKRGAAGPDVESPQISWYATWLHDQTAEKNIGEKILDYIWKDYYCVADRFSPQADPYTAQFDGQAVPYKFFEVWKWATEMVLDLVKVAFTAKSFEEGNKVLNIVDVSLLGLKSLYTLINGFTTGKGWVIGQNLFGTTVLAWEKGKPLLEALVSDKKGTGFHLWKQAATLKWMTPKSAGKDMFETWLEQGLGDLVPSVLTLVNGRQAPPDALHYKAVEGTLALSALVGHWLGALATSLPIPGAFDGKRHYGYHGRSPWEKVRFFGTDVLFCGVGFSLFFALPGYWLAWALSGKDNTEDFGSILGKVLASHLPIDLFPPFYHFWWDGRTDGGKWGVDGTGQIIAFRGYPDPSDSPYELPWASGESKAVKCVQGHHGFWSHHSWKNYIYAADFEMGYGDDILAMRSGTVVDYDDTWPDTSDEANYIIIKHDSTAEGTLPNPIHDLGVDGAPTTTYSVYRHGRHFGVRHAFAARGILPEDIVGSPVEKGHVILYAGDTGSDAPGVQVHVHVTAEANIGAPSIPFVFKGMPSEGFIRSAPAGVPKTGEQYKSTNVKKATDSPNGRYQPPNQEGQIAASGVENDGRRYVLLDEKANNRAEDYKDAHIFIAFEDSGQKYTLYKKIIRYDSGNRKAYVEGTWDTPIDPPPGSDYLIGAPPRKTDDTFGQQFSYLAAPNNPDWTPYKLA